MRKPVRVILIATLILLVVFVVGVLYKPGDRRSWAVSCYRTPEEQIRSIAYVLRVQIHNIKNTEQDGYRFCEYGMSVKQSLFQKSGDVPLDFKLVEQSQLASNANCRPIGSELLVILDEQAIKHKLKSCSGSAIVDLAKQDELLNLLAQKEK